MQRNRCAANRLGIVALLTIIPVACDPVDTRSDFAEIEFTAAGGNRIDGTLTLSEQPGYLDVNGSITGLSPGTYEVHLHQTTACDGQSSTEEAPGESPRVLGKFTVDERLLAEIDRLDEATGLPDELAPLLGRAATIVAAGESGRAIACGLVDPIPEPDYTP